MGKLNIEIRRKRDENLRILLTTCENMYIIDTMSINDIVKKLRSQGKSIAVWRLCHWLKSKEITRTPTQTLVAQRKLGIISDECTIEECKNKCKGRRKYCDKCIPDGTAHRAYLHYGISQQQVDKLLIEQGGVCSGCKCVMIRGAKASAGKENVMCIDHDHLTGKVRGVICHACNRTLGYARDRIDVLRSLATYLENHNIS